jgi:hypothetical protein
MTHLTPSRVLLLLETTKVMQPACSATKIRGRTAFCHGEAHDWVFWRASAKVSSGKFRSIDFYSIDRLRGKFDQSILSSIDRVLQNFRIFQAIPHEFCHSSLINLQNIKTQKLTKASENNKAKGLTYVNQGVQIHNIWHSSLVSHFNFKQQEHERRGGGDEHERGVGGDFLKTNNVVFTKERSNLWGAHVPLWSICTFEDFIH